ncbi:hypothetical protein DFA_09791 [Cavenderia fasciculata]|uniref:Uncharacterized protein n=1 Tax=Cavenderia fasciculata TaxID=261658 RepID=F4Q8L9_CACFS|nr:uncharacterized protein DFA_09791 [Cavenderia fasciculata]EGG16119.1 hypothetical protein DFA_09791 [Cavenderia fasciculata]|eukprot:XP_004352451.1 hypothetical protein DFA_09791 [Cavenderia fasciculata]
MKIINLLYIFVILLLTSTTWAQYQDDPCELYRTTNGSLTVTLDSEAVCWRLLPEVGVAFYPAVIKVQLISCDLSSNENNTLVFVQGDSSADSEMASYSGLINTPQQPVYSYDGKVLIYKGWSDNITFTVNYEASTDKHYKPSVMMLITVIIAFTVPTMLIACITCCTNKEKKRQLKTRQSVMFWIGSIIALIIMAVLLSQKL